jgi:hypothetical protein
MDERTHAYILEKLSGAVPEDDIIFELCQQTDIDWETAGSLVRQVKEEHVGEIQARQMPLKGALALVFLIFGVLLTVAPVVYLLSILGVLQLVFNLLTGGATIDPQTVLALMRNRCALLQWYELPSALFCILLGPTVIAVNIRAMRDTWRELFFHL